MNTNTHLGYCNSRLKFHNKLYKIKMLNSKPKSVNEILPPTH